MAYRPTRRQWVKLWVNEWLDGTTRYQLTDAQRAFWIDLLALAGRSRYPGIIASGRDGKKWVGYPLNEYQARAPSIDILPTLRLLEKTQKIRIQKTGIRLKQPLFKIEIVNWDKYQSEYLRQRPYRKADTDKVTTKVQTEEEGEGDKEVEVEGEEEKREKLLIEPKSLYNIWQEEAFNLPQLRILTDERKQRCRTLLRKNNTVGFITGFRKAVRRANETPFLRGENDTGWRATFDWLIKSDNWIHVLEGNYDDSGKRTGSKAKQRQDRNVKAATDFLRSSGRSDGDIRRELQRGRDAGEDRNLLHPAGKREDNSG